MYYLGDSVGIGFPMEMLTNRINRSRGWPIDRPKTIMIIIVNRGFNRWRSYESTGNLNTHSTKADGYKCACIFISN